MATIEGARALGLGHVVGSIESGKRADVVMVDLRNARSSPHHDPLGAFVFSSNTNVVRTVLVDGRVLVRDGELVGVDERDIVGRAQRASSELVARAWAGVV
jgi:cytosine/adenosine deaminase-related metal-dependent hydrolase